MAGRRFLSRLQHLSASLRSRSACTSGHAPAAASSTLCPAPIFTASATCSAMLRSSSPVSSCRITTPNAYASESVVSSPVMKNRGSMYPMVPIGFVRRLMVSSSSGFRCTARAVPKSPSRLTLPASRRMLGRLEWRYLSADRSSARILTRSFHRRPLESLSMSVPLGRCSYTRLHDSGHTPINLTMFGCSNLLSNTTCGSEFPAKCTEIQYFQNDQHRLQRSFQSLQKRLIPLYPGTWVTLGAVQRTERIIKILLKGIHLEGQ
ncbi:hypothetical protein U9M48_012860 [Paspalum notatum var. saurae]|uniref:Uncharacterized protein n=1 Tax=Paspalum notatum var. saurae TaxID=547442 RepID=A0AAQ3T0K5_PASNO